MDTFNSVYKLKEDTLFNNDLFHKQVEELAYYKYKNRGIKDGHDLDDWLEAEAEMSNQYFYWFHDEK